jgi:2-(1,2-epoxy-1,2-dihydrophenyl)acetyl-CoA isomerase
VVHTVLNSILPDAVFKLAGAVKSGGAAYGHDVVLQAQAVLTGMQWFTNEAEYLVLATPRARFCMAFARIGLIPDYGALYTLPRIVGVARAKEIMYSAREIGAAEARDLGIVLEIAEADALLPRAKEMARALAGASPVALSLTKSALNSSLASDLSTMLDIEAAGQGIAGVSDYAKESFRRFAAKEPAQFIWPAPK